MKLITFREINPIKNQMGVQELESVKKIIQNNSR